MSKFSKEYLELVEKVEAIDKEAAQYMLEEAPNLPSFCESGDLANCFMWGNTPHGLMYWLDLSVAMDHVAEEVTWTSYDRPLNSRSWFETVIENGQIKSVGMGMAEKVDANGNIIWGDPQPTGVVLYHGK